MFYHQLQLLDISRTIHTLIIEYTCFEDDDTILNWLESVQVCSKELSKWSNELALVLRVNGWQDARISAPRAVPTMLMLHAYHSALVVGLHGLVSCHTVSQHALQLMHFQEEAHLLCMSAVKCLSDLTRSMKDIMLNQLGWPFAWSIWVAARYLLVCDY